MHAAEGDCLKENGTRLLLLVSGRSQFFILFQFLSVCVVLFQLFVVWVVQVVLVRCSVLQSFQGLRLCSCFFFLVALGYFGMCWVVLGLCLMCVFSSCFGCFSSLCCFRSFWDRCVRTSHTGPSRLLITYGIISARDGDFLHSPHRLSVLWRNTVQKRRKYRWPLSDPSSMQWCKKRRLWEGLSGLSRPFTPGLRFHSESACFENASRLFVVCAGMVVEGPPPSFCNAPSAVAASSVRSDLATSSQHSALISPLLPPPSHGNSNSSTAAAMSRRNPVKRSRGSAAADARLVTLAELAPVLLSKAPLPPPTPASALLQWSWGSTYWQAADFFGHASCSVTATQQSRCGNTYSLWAEKEMTVS